MSDKLDLILKAKADKEAAEAAAIQAAESKAEKAAREAAEAEARQLNQAAQERINSMAAEAAQAVKQFDSGMREALKLKAEYIKAIAALGVYYWQSVDIAARQTEAATYSLDQCGRKYRAAIPCNINKPVNDPQALAIMPDQVNKWYKGSRINLRAIPGYGLVEI